MVFTKILLIFSRFHFLICLFIFYSTLFLHLAKLIEFFKISFLPTLSILGPYYSLKSPANNLCISDPLETKQFIFNFLTELQSHNSPRVSAPNSNEVRAIISLEGHIFLFNINTL